MNCCDQHAPYGCNQGRDCPVRMNAAHGVCIQAAHQSHYAARTAPHHPRAAQAGDMLPIQFVGPEPVEPTGPLDDCMPLTSREERQIMAGIVGFLVMFLTLVYAGLWFDWASAVRRAVAAAWAVVLP